MSKKKLIPWKCPECGATHDSCGKGECRGNDRHGCDGLCCDCEVGSEDPEHGQVEGKPCLRAECYHCGWEGRMPPAMVDYETTTGLPVPVDGKIAVLALEELDEIEADLKEHGTSDVLRGCMARAIKTIRARDACPASKRYKGTKAPACNDGVGCLACWRTYAERLRG